MCKRTAKLLMFRSNPFEFVLNLLQKCFIGKSSWYVNALSNLLFIVRVAGDQRLLYVRDIPKKSLN